MARAKVLSQVRTTCPYCGVGCGLMVTTTAAGPVIAGDLDHPANFGRLCSKGAALGETLDLEGRLLEPHLDGQPVGWEAALDTVADGFKRVIARHGPEAVAFYVSGQLLSEDYYAANKLMKGFIGANNIDTNSRLCMSSTVAGQVRAFGADTVPGSYDDIEQCDLLVLVGSNAAWCHPVLFQRIKAAKLARPGYRVVVIDPRRTPTCEVADLHLPLKPGTDVLLFNGLFAYLAQRGVLDQAFIASHLTGYEETFAAAVTDAGDVAAVADGCDLPAEELLQFYDWFATTERGVTAFSQGVNQSSSGTDKVNTIINCHLATGRIGKPGMGPLSLTGQPNAMGGREVGGLATSLACHLRIEDPAHRELVARFWGGTPISDRPGLKAVELFKAIETGAVRAVWILGTNPLVSLPDADRVRDALARCELVVVSDCMRHTDTNAVAKVLLPALAWGEKSGTVTNSERRLSRQRPFLPAPGLAKPDWWMLSQVATRMGFAGFDYDTPAEIFREHAALSSFENAGVLARDFDIGALANGSDDDYEALPPVQWPVTAAFPKGRARFFDDGRFFTPDGRARLVAVTCRAPGQLPDETYPLVLNTGRVRDHWHTMTRTGKSPRLSSHRGEPLLDVHPEDAARYRLGSGGFARITSSFGSTLARVRVTPGQDLGSVFLPMHWNRQFASAGRAGAVTNPFVDPWSGQPEFKHTPVRVEPVALPWRALLVSRDRLAEPAADYWALARAEACWRYEIAAAEAPADCAGWLRHLAQPAGWQQPGLHAAHGTRFPTKGLRLATGQGRCEIVCAERTLSAQWIEYRDSAGGYRAAAISEGRLQLCLFSGTDLSWLDPAWVLAEFAAASTAADRHNLLAGVSGAAMEEAGRIVCACHQVGLNALMHAIQKGKLTTVAALGSALKAGTNCGSCIPELAELLSESSTAPISRGRSDGQGQRAA